MIISSEHFILLGSFLVVALNCLLIALRWPSKPNAGISCSGRFNFLLDPLVASQIVPLATDLYFSLEWRSGCSSGYVATITFISLVLYTCSGLLCYRLVQQFNVMTSSEDSSFDRPTSASVSSQFTWTIAINFVLTWVTLPVVKHALYLNEEFHSEVCMPYFITDMMINVFVVCLSVQVVFVGVYFFTGKSASHDGSLGLHDKKKETCGPSTRLSILYSLMAMFCLIATNLLRFIFMNCWCESLFILSRSLPVVILLLGLKLPCVELLQWMCPSLMQVKSAPV